MSSGASAREMLAAADSRLLPLVERIAPALLAEMELETPEERATTVDSLLSILDGRAVGIDRERARLKAIDDLRLARWYPDQVTAAKYEQPTDAAELLRAVRAAQPRDELAARRPTSRK